MKIVRLERIEKIYNVKNELYALIGGENPTGSIKDVTVYGMLCEYKKAGRLTQGTTIVEATSGNTGISLSYYQKEFGYKAVIVMPKSMSVERRNKIAKYGAELFLVDGGMKECEKTAEELCEKTENSFVFSQFDCPYNPLAHYTVTAHLIYKTVPDADIFVAGIGTGGTITGCARYLKEKNGEIKIVGAEPFESPLLTKGYASSHLIQGIGANFVPKILDKSLIDDFEDVKGEDAINTAKIIRKEENLDVGYSSGASLAGAIDYLKRTNAENKKVVVVFPDKGDRYSW